ncbi:unnamed protein product [Adineta ricciae]|uniref:G-protein coupled receptors family 1 profile domain-containing protein n=1 Tax=Adineta ricciae TaxID=249248 RepID=A0A814N5T7_ADIRI|nr:unnamed protein product [Adineta ricciae]CAF1452184.1 unnamed protein product [Adineta ricciae]
MGNVPDFCRNSSIAINETSYAKLSECWTETRIADVLRKCLPLIILPVSLICNSLSFIALRSRHMRGTSTAFFMLALSVLDPLVLLTKNLVYFPALVASHAILCKILYFLIYVLGYTNVWILVIMTADKFFAVWFPLKVSYFCTITRAKYVCIFLFAMTSIISLHHFWTIDSIQYPHYPNRRFCYYDLQRYGLIQHTWRYMDFVIWCFLPFILILTLSVLIIYKLRQKEQTSHSNIRQILGTNSNNEKVSSQKRLSKQLQQQQQSQQQRKSDSQGFEMRSTQKSEVIRSRQRHITLMLLAVAVVFLLLTLPNSIYFVLDLTYGFNKLPTDENYEHWLRYRRLTILTVIMFQLSDLQHATNFFLYLLTSDKFRRSVLMTCASSVHFAPSIFNCCCRDKIDSASSFQNHYSGQKYDKKTMSYRLSATERSSISANPRYMNTQQVHQQSSAAYRSSSSRPSRSIIQSL